MVGRGESDVRMVYTAFAISHMLNDWSGVNIEKAVDYIKRCRVRIRRGAYWARLINFIQRHMRVVMARHLPTKRKVITKPETNHLESFHSLYFRWPHILLNSIALFPTSRSSFFSSFEWRWASENYPLVSGQSSKWGGIQRTYREGRGRMLQFLVWRCSPCKQTHTMILLGP